MIEYSSNNVSNFKLFAFATGSYQCRCEICGIIFIGDKRAVQCLQCAIAHADTLNNAVAVVHKVGDGIYNVNTPVGHCDNVNATNAAEHVWSKLIEMEMNDEIRRDRDSHDN